LNWSTAVEVFSTDDSRAAGSVFIGGTINGIIAALDTSTGTSRFDDLNIMIVSLTDASLRISLTSNATARVILTTGVLRVESIESSRPDTSSKLCIAATVLAFTGLESDI